MDKDLISPEGLDINEKYHNWIFKALHEEGRITGVYDIGGSNYVKISYSELAITEAGIIFLQENSGIERAKTFLKDLKAMIPGA